MRELLEDIVRQQVAADVPISAMLSGGLDSSAVCAPAGQVLAGRGRAEPPKTFSMEFSHHLDHFRPDEVHDSPGSPYIAETAARLGTDTGSRSSTEGTRPTRSGRRRSCGRWSGP